ncbi:Cas4 family exonuclease [Streptomyces phage Euratis]|uniref:Cas4 family exonuclease n=1 Tax=Streptomyces phage Euratis TaxID=2510569 RepID=A0A411B0Y0_9CAUD|nr:Cas4 family exonuclease [Streptomyces phage Euratis]
MGKVRTVYRGGSRFYVHPENRDVVHPGVTSVIGMLPKQNFLGPWNAKMTAELAVDSIEFIQDMAARDKAGAVQYLSGAARRYTKVRADVGSEAHDLFERIMRGEYVGRVRSDLQPYVDHFREFLEAVNPEFVRAEDVAWSDTYGYAGSFDVWLYVWLDENGKPTPDRSGVKHLIMGDWKTGKNTYPDVALQLAAYERADYVMNGETGEVEPMPEFDGAAVLHITDETWAFKPVDTSDDVFAQFLHLRATFDWDRDLSRKVIGKPIAKKSTGRLVTGTQRRAR